MHTTKYITSLTYFSNFLQSSLHYSSLYWSIRTVPSGSAIFRCRGIEKWDGRRRRHRSIEKWTIQRSSIAEWQIQFRSIHIQNLSFGIQSAVIYSIAGTKRLIGNPRRSMECVSILSNSHHRMYLLKNKKKSESRHFCL